MEKKLQKLSFSVCAVMWPVEGAAQEKRVSTLFPVLPERETLLSAVPSAKQSSWQNGTL